MVDMGCDEPHLGLATTENLFDELIARFEVGHPFEDMYEILMIAKATLTTEMKTYRTVDH